MCKATEMEDFPSRRGGTLADNRRTPLDVKSGQMFWWNRKFLPKKNCLLTTPRLMLYSTNSAALSRPIRPRRGGRAAECGGLLNRCRGQNSYRGFESPPLRQILDCVLSSIRKLPRVLKV